MYYMYLYVYQYMCACVVVIVHVIIWDSRGLPVGFHVAIAYKVSVVRRVYYHNHFAGGVPVGGRENRK